MQNRIIWMRVIIIIILVLLMLVLAMDCLTWRLSSGLHLCYNHYNVSELRETHKDDVGIYVSGKDIEA
jgi:flagellar basal body-associated protein FliL